MIVIFNARGPNHNLIVVGPPNKSPPWSTDPSLWRCCIDQGPKDLRIIPLYTWRSGVSLVLGVLTENMRITSRGSATPNPQI